MLARIEAERRLQEAEVSLKRLEKAVHKEGDDERDEEVVQQEMQSDVRTLKSKVLSQSDFVYLVI